jgi:hypothetical protein
MSTSPSTQIFPRKQRAFHAGKGLIFLVFGGSGVYQSFLRYNLEVDRFWNSWWFFALFSLGFLYLAMETFYKVFVARLVFTPEGIILHDFPKALHIPWREIQRVGEFSLSDRKADFGILLKDAAFEKDGIFAMPAISLKPYFNDWNDSPINEWLKKNKPHLLKENLHGK